MTEEDNTLPPGWDKAVERGVHQQGNAIRGDFGIVAKFLRGMAVSDDTRLYLALENVRDYL